MEYGLIVAVFALLMGVLNVLGAHSRTVVRREGGWPYSLILLGSAIFLGAAGVLTGPDGATMRWALEVLLFPLQAAFFSLLAFFLVPLAWRAARIDSLESLLFVGSAFRSASGHHPAWREPDPCPG